MSKYFKSKAGGLEDVAANMTNYATENGYQDLFKKELEKTGVGIASMSPKEKSAFFNKIDSKYTAKGEETKINEVSERDKRDNLQKIKAINDMVSDLSGTSNSDARKLLDLGKPLNYYINPRGATDAQKKQFIAFASKFSNKMSFRDKREYEGYIKAVTEAVDNPYAVGMAQAMKAKDDQPPLKKSTITKAHDIAKSIEKDQKEEVSQKEIDKFHTSLDKLVHKSFGHSSDEKKKEIKEEDAYQNDRFAVSDNTAKIDNANTSDKSNHVYAPNAKTAVAMYKAGVKSYKDNAEMRRKFPMAVEDYQKEEIQLTESHFKVGEKVECIASGMKGEVIQVDPKEEGKYYTVKREDGTTMKYAPNELKSLQKENADPAGDEMNLKKLLATGQRKTWAQLKKETTALEGYMTRMKQEEELAKKKKQTDTEEKITPVEMNPKVDYRF